MNYFFKFLLCCSLLPNGQRTGQEMALETGSSSSTSTSVIWLRAQGCLIFWKVRMRLFSAATILDAVLFCQMYETVVIAGLTPSSLFPSLLFFPLSFSSLPENPPTYSLQVGHNQTTGSCFSTNSKKCSVWRISPDFKVK